MTRHFSQKSHAGGQEDYEKLLKLIIREMQMSSWRGDTIHLDDYTDTSRCAR